MRVEEKSTDRKDEHQFSRNCGITGFEQQRIAKIPGVDHVLDWGTFAVRVFADPNRWDEISPQVIQILEGLEGGSECERV